MSCLATFESLPTEIHILILKATEDWDTLQAFIGSSPQLLQLYRSTREPVILSVLKNQISQDPLYTLLISIKLRLPRSERCEDEQDYLFQALERWEQHRTVLFHNLQLSHVKYIVQLERAIEHLITDFADTRLAVIEDTLNIPHAERSYLSANERRRLGRAFYHMEAYAQMQRLFDVHRIAKSTQMGWQVTRRFVTNISTNELEELLCICQYVKEKSLEYADRTEEDLRQEILNWKPYYIDPEDNDSRWEYDEVLFSASFERYGQDSWSGDQIGTPLVCLKGIFTQESPAKRLHYARAHVFDYRQGPLYLRCVINAIPKPGRLGEIALIDEDRNDLLGRTRHAGKLGKINKALAWALTSGFWPYRRTLDCVGFYGSLRSWGYAVWDDERIEHLGVLNLSLLSVGNWPEWDKKRGERRRRQTVEDWSRDQEEIWKEQGLIEEGRRIACADDTDGEDGICALCSQPIPRYHG